MLSFILISATCWTKLVKRLVPFKEFIPRGHIQQGDLCNSTIILFYFFVVFDQCCWLLYCCWLPSRVLLSSLLLSCCTQCYCEALRAQTRWGALEVLFIIIIIIIIIHN